MITIKMGAYEKADLLHILDYAKEKKYEDFNNDKMTAKLLKMDIDKINVLKARVNGKYTEDYLQPSRAFIRQFPREKDDLPKAPYFRR